MQTTPNTSPFDFNVQRAERRRQRTRTYLLHESFHELFNHQGHLRLAYRVGDAFYFQVYNRPPLLTEEVRRLKRLMIHKIKENKELKRVELSKREALNRLKADGREQSYRWVKDTKGKLPRFYEGVVGLLCFKGRLAETTMETGAWDLLPYPPGLLLRIAPDGSGELPPFKELPNLFRTFFEAESWGAIHGAIYISDVNHKIRTGDIEVFVQVAEALHALKIARIADRIQRVLPQPRVVLISGPSSSGKTSFSKRLQVQLRLIGIHPETLSLDNYYQPRSKIPLGPDGKPDYEALEALDVELFNEHLVRLVAGQEIRPPILDFESHRRRSGKPMKLKPEGILIIEGIHGLNPRLTSHLTAPSVFKIFVSALNHLSLDHLSRVSTTDLRLIRRMVRDRRARGYSAEDTLTRWPSVREGELKYIFPYQERADVMFNSALPFELNALKPMAEEALKEVHGRALLGEVRRLRSLLDAVTPLSHDWVDRHISPTSIFREFFGGSVLVE